MILPKVSSLTNTAISFSFYHKPLYQFRQKIRPCNLEGPKPTSFACLYCSTMGENKVPVRVLRIIARINVGGPAIQVVNLMNLLPQEKFQQLLVTGYCGKDELDYLDAKQIQVPLKRINFLGRSINPFSDLIALFSIRRQILRFNPHIIHTHTFKAGLLGRLAAKLTRMEVCTVHTFHGHLLYGYYGRLGTSIVIFLEKFLALNTTKLIAVGKTVRDDLLAQGIGNLDKFEVVNPGFSVGNFASVSRHDFGFQENDFICGWFGRITDIKRVDRILELASLTSQMKNVNIKFLVVGDGKNREILEKRAENLDLPITFLGWRTNIYPLMNLCNIVLCTSDNEGTPISLIEAQILGKPVISTNVGSISEIMLPYESGFALDYNAELFVQKIIELQSNSERYDEFSKSARTFTSENFQPKAFTARHMKIYEEILGI